jgi:hypothetical protein
VLEIVVAIGQIRQMMGVMSSFLSERRKRREMKGEKKRKGLFVNYLLIYSLDYIFYVR